MCGGEPPLRFRCWDGSELVPSCCEPGAADADGREPATDVPEAAAGGTATASAGSDEARETTIVITSPNAIRRILWQPNELGFSRAYVAGEIDVDGDIWSLFRLQALLSHPDRPNGLGAKTEGGRRLLVAARAVGALGRPLEPPPEEARMSGRLHTRDRDAQAVAHHYDVSNDFYQLFLGESMTYSCAYFPTPDTPLADAQRAKHDLICRKLGLRPGMRLLDVGCGWGGMVLHAVRNYGVEAVGVTLSQRQVDHGREAVAAAGLGDRIDIRFQDYRDVSDGPFDAVSSVGMVEHVGAAQLPEYFSSLYGQLRPGGRLLNHGICWPRGSRGLDPKSFMAHYVFPDGELHEVGIVIQAMQAEGFEARDDESLREHYALTLRHWVRNLEEHWDEAVGIAGAGRARVWRLYMAGSARNFEMGNITVHQVLGVRPHADGRSEMPLTRAALLDPAPAGSPEHETASRGTNRRDHAAQGQM
ncbi:MAG: class I SAM-dependent methyltransferase [Actinobacteria bacterium]|nr:class I SAM-dependent methyltransferase [Actinomycetota bacterium]